MAVKGLKRQTETVSISAAVTESGANTFTATTIQMNLDPLSNEVFVVTRVDIDQQNPDLIAGTNCSVDTSLSTTARTTVGDLSNPNVVEIAKKTIKAAAGLTTAVAFSSELPVGTAADTDFLAICFTDDMFLNIAGTNNAGAKNSQVRILGYRAIASSSIYAAGVQSELLS